MLSGGASVRTAALFKQKSDNSLFVISDIVMVNSPFAFLVPIAYQFEDNPLTIIFREDCIMFFYGVKDP